MRHHQQNMNPTQRFARLAAGFVSSLVLLTACGQETPTVTPQPQPRITASALTLSASPSPAPTTDVAPPTIRIEPIPARSAPNEGLKLIVTADDPSGVARLAILTDGQTVAETRDSSLRHNLDTRRLAPGIHQIVIEAEDSAGNMAQAALSFEIALPPTTTATSAPPTAPPTSASTATAAPTPTATAAPTTATAKPATISTGEVVINTYAYQQALYTDPAQAGHPYPLLRHDRVGAPAPHTYQTIILRNEYLELTLLPELGGRIYQARYLPTDQALLYNNQVIKPTRWGPTDQGWWLAAGGIEFCLPVDEHGYVTAEPWEIETTHRADGSAVATVHLVERSRQIAAQVVITLKPGEAGFHLRSTLTSQSEQAQSFQYWINAMLSPGGRSVQPTLRFYYPAAEVIVHSRGDRALPDAHGAMAWPNHQGRDMSLYGNWRDWLGFFAPNLAAPYTAIYDEAAQIGLVRAFPPEIARGVKLFGFGQGFTEVGAYTDDGSKYVEMWGGLTPTFWDYAILQPGASVGWDETWYVIAQSGGPSIANDQAALNVALTDGRLSVTVAAPAAHAWTLRAAQGDRELARQACIVRPDAPFTWSATWPSRNSSERITVELLNAHGEIVVSYVI